MRCVSKIVLALFCLPILMGAAVYRWVDENGVVNYTQLKPEGMKAELVSANTGQRVESSGPAPAGEQGDPDPALNESQEKMLADLRAAEAQRQQKVTEVRDANCRRAREVLERLTSRGRIRIVGDDGVERVMPEEEREGRIAEAQRGVAVNCSETASR